MRNILLFSIIFTSISLQVEAQLSATASSQINSKCNGTGCNYNGPSILINEVMIYPSNADGSLYGTNTTQRGEWIELYNPDLCRSVNVGCYFLGNASRDGNADYPGGFEIPANTIVPARGFLVVRGMNAPAVPSNLLVQNGGRTVEIVVNASSAYCYGNGSRLWFPDNGGWFAFYNSQGVVQDAIMWGSVLASTQNMIPCNPMNGCPYTGSLLSWANIPAAKKTIIDVNPISSTNSGKSHRRNPDGGSWIVNSQATPTYGNCNASCATAPVITCTGQATVTANGGQPPYTYWWNDGQNQTTATATGLCAGNYCVTVTDALGATTTACTTVSNYAPAVSLGSFPAVCITENPFALNGGSPPGGSYSGPGVSGGVFYPSTAGTGVKTITYAYYNVDSCGSSVTSSITVNATPAVGFNAVPSLCAGAAPITLTQGTPSGGTYSGTGVSNSVFNPSISGIGTFTLTYTYTNASGCSAFSTRSVTVYAEPVVNLASPPSLCANASPYTLTQGSPAGGVYSGPGVSAGQFNPAVTGQGTFTLSYSYTDIHGCTSSNTANITVNQLPLAYTTANQSICQGSVIGLGGTTVPGNTYSWTSSPPGYTSTLANPAVQPNVSTTYTLVETGNGGCSNTHSVTITINSLPIPDVIPNTTICSGSQLSLGGSPVAGNSYLWSSVPPGFSSTISNPTVTPTATTQYNLVETINSTSCTASASVTITVNQTPAAYTGNSTTVCAGNPVTLGGPPQTGNTYLWSSSPPGFNSTVSNPVVSPMSNTSYNLIETNTVSGCTHSNSVSVGVNPLPPAIVSNPTTICSGTSISLGGMPSAGHTYSWTSDPPGFTSNNPNPSVSPTVTTTYTLLETITTTGCSRSANTLITVNPTPAAYTGPATSVCYADPVVLGGAPLNGNTYQWSSIPTGFSSSVSNPLLYPTTSATYFLIETVTATGCTKTNSVVVTVNPLPITLILSNSAICSGSSVSIGGNSAPGNAYFWSSSPAGFSSSSSNPTVSPTSTTTYTLIQTISATGCTKTGFVTITVNPLPVANTGSSGSICIGNPVVLGAAPTVGNTYSWTSVPAGFTSSVSNPLVYPLASTTYNLTETITATGCTKSNSVAITVNPLPSPVVTSSTSICAGTAISLGGAPATGHTYIWSSNPSGYSSNSSNPSVTPMVTTTYTLTEIINETGCTKTGNVTITVNPLPAAVTGSNTSTCQGNPLVLGGAPVSGNTYNWTSNPPGFTSSVSNPLIYPSASTTYNLTETITATGCTKTNSVIVGVNPLPNPFVISNTAICAGLSVNLGGSPTSGNSYIWSSNPPGFSSSSSNPSVTPSTTTSYTLTQIINSTGCSKTASVTITVNPSPTVSLAPFASICKDSSPLFLNGGTPVSGTYSGQGVTGSFFNPGTLNPGTYNITYTYTTAGGCSGNSVQPIIVEQKPKLYGLIKYDNVPNTHLDSVRVKLKNGTGTVIDSVFTNSSGQYAFNCRTNGSYSLGCSTLRKWGGANATDALMVTQYAVGLINFSPLRQIAADVNLSGSINSGDALMIMKRFVGTINSFPAGNYAIESINGITINNNDFTGDMMAVCMGDVNGSYIPIIGAKSYTNISVSNSSVVAGVPGNEISIPVLSGKELSTNAISMVLDFPGDQLEITGITSKLTGFEYHIDGTQLRFAWYSLEAADFNPDDVIITIKARILSSKDKNFPPEVLAGEETEFADSQARPIKEVSLKLPRIEIISSVQILTTAKNNGLFEAGYSQPDGRATQLYVDCYTDLDARISLYSIQGDEVNVLCNGNLSQGQHQFNLNFSSVRPGLYFCRIEASSGNNSGSGLYKILIIK